MIRARHTAKPIPCVIRQGEDSGSFAESQRLEQKIRSNLASLGHDADAEVNPRSRCSNAIASNWPSCASNIASLG